MPCFDCGIDGPTHDHHVVPRVLGGRATVALCERCHGLVHSRHMTHHAMLTRAGLERKRKQNRKVSKDPPYGWKFDVDDPDLMVPNPEEASTIAAIVAMKKSRMSIRAIVDALDKRGLKSRKGTLWHPTQIWRILAKN